MVYLIHFARPYRHAKHYIGFTQNARTLPLRVEHHRKGSGARLMAVVVEAGIDFEVVRTWPKADRNDERALKNRKNTPRLCPVCSGRKAAEREGGAAVQRRRAA